MKKLLQVLIPLVIISSCITPKCYRGVFSSKTLIVLDEKWEDKIIFNDTLFSNEYISLINSTIECSNKRTRKMKVLLNKSDNTKVLVPHDSELKHDSILYVNSRFFISPLDRGLIVSNKVKRGTTHFEYPEDENLYYLTIKMKKDGLYRFENGEFKLVTKSFSNDAYKKHCSNDTCYIPFPGILYDKKINLKELKTLKGL